MSAILIFAVNNAVLHSQLLETFSGYSITSSSGSTLNHFPQPNSNPALIMTHREPQIDFSVSPFRFLMPELNPATISAVVPLSGSINAGASLSAISCDLYKEFALQPKAAIKLTEDFSAGIAIEFSQLYVKDFDSYFSWKVNLGATVALNEILKAGLSLNNINRSYYDGGNKTPRQTAMLGLGLTLPSNFTVDGDLHLNFDDNSGFSIAVGYDYIDALSFRLACLSYPRSAEFGLSFFGIKELTFASTVAYIDWLGFASSIGLSYNFK